MMRVAAARAAVRAGIRRGAGFETWRHEVNQADLTGRATYDGLYVQNIAFESLRIS